MIELLPSILALLLSATVEPEWVASDSFAFRRFSQADGLSDSTIFSITHDATGMIWLGTSSGGVNTYDGYQFRAFQVFLGDILCAKRVPRQQHGVCEVTRVGIDMSCRHGFRYRYTGPGNA